MKLKQIRAGERFVEYELPSYDALSDEIIEEAQRGNKRLTFFSSRKAPKCPMRFPKVSGKYVMRVIFRAPEKDFRMEGKPGKQSGVRLVIPASFKELDKHSRASMMAEFIRQNKKIVTKAFMREFEGYHKQSLKLTQSVLVMKNGKVVGMRSILPGTAQDGTRIFTLAWSYLDSGLSKAEKDDALFQLSAWTKSVARDSVITSVGHNTPDTWREIKGQGMRPCRVLAEKL